MTSYSAETRDVTLGVYAGALSHNCLTLKNAQIPDIAVLANLHTVADYRSSPDRCSLADVSAAGSK